MVNARMGSGPHPLEERTRRPSRRCRDQQGKRGILLPPATGMLTELTTSRCRDNSVLVMGYVRSNSHLRVEQAISSTSRDNYMPAREARIGATETTPKIM